MFNNRNLPFRSSPSRLTSVQAALVLLAIGITSQAEARKRPKNSREPLDSTTDAGSQGVATVAPKNATEKQAARYSREALGVDFEAGHFFLGEGKLREAIRICESACSVPFQSRLHRDLGFLYVSGLEHLDDAREQFSVAATMDPTVALTPDMRISGVTEVFDKAITKGSKNTRKRRLAQSESEKPEAELEPDLTPAQEEPAGDRNLDVSSAPDNAAQMDLVRNWFTLSIQQDWVYHARTLEACGPSGPYRCFDADKVYRVLAPGQFGGNQVSGGGALPGMLRLLVGFDRVVHPHLSLGIRVGSVISGKAPTLANDQSVLGFHGEARVALWIGPDVFSHAGLRPYVFLSGGIAEADGRIVVDFTVPRDSTTYKLDAWKRSGHSFVGPGLGVQAAFTKYSGPLVEFRYMQFLSPNVPVLGGQLGYAIGF